MPSILTRPISKSPACQLWLSSILAMGGPVIVILVLFRISGSDDATDKLIIPVGFFVYLIVESNLISFFVYFGDSIRIGVSISLIVGFYAMWFLILALPVFNSYSLKRRILLHFIQFTYSTIQAAAGYAMIVKGL